MKNLIILFVVISLYNCREAEKKKKHSDSDVLVNENPIKDSVMSLSEFRKLAIDFTPSNIDLSIDLNEYLKDLNVQAIVSKYRNSDSLLTAIKIYLLKLNLYHLKKANQGYNLLTMRNGQTKILIDYYLSSKSIDMSKPFIGTSYIGQIEKEEIQSDAIVVDLIKKIEGEEKRIEKEASETIKSVDKKLNNVNGSN